MFEYIPLIVIGSSLWVLYDAHKLGVRKGMLGGNFDYGPTEWFLFSLLLWIVGFPLYLSKRQKYVEPISMDSDSRNCPFCAETIKKKAIVCLHCGKDLPKPPPPNIDSPSYCPSCENDNAYSDYTNKMFCPHCKDYVKPLMKGARQ
ncbi:MAG: zinc ribbon domain-containing protein [Syntrophales bacterium]